MGATGIEPMTSTVSRESQCCILFFLLARCSFLFLLVAWYSAVFAPKTAPKCYKKPVAPIALFKRAFSVIILESGAN